MSVLLSHLYVVGLYAIVGIADIAGTSVHVIALNLSIGYWSLREGFQSNFIIINDLS